NVSTNARCEWAFRPKGGCLSYCRSLLIAQLRNKKRSGSKPDLFVRTPALSHPLLFHLIKTKQVPHVRARLDEVGDAVFHQHAKEGIERFAQRRIQRTAIDQRAFRSVIF